MAIVRSIKNYAKGFSEVQIKVREATSNDSWGPSGSLMNEIAQLTFNEQEFIEIMDMLDKRLNDKGKNWRHVFKALLVLDYCLHVGSENVVLYAKENIYVVRTLKEFQHIDDSGKDVGFNVRQKAKEITGLLMDEQRLKEERRSRNQMQDRMANVGDYMSDALYNGSGRNGEDHAVYRQPGYIDEDKDLRRAIEESKHMAEQDFRNRGEGTDDDLRKALEESEREARESERKKKEALDRENSNNLFNPTPAAITNTSSNNAFQPFPMTQNFDNFMNPYGQQLQSSGMSFAEPIQQQLQAFNNPYANNNGFNNYNLQAQMTGMPSAQMGGFQQQLTHQQFQTQPQQQLQPQFTAASNPFGQFGQQTNIQQQQGTSLPLNNKTTEMNSQYSNLSNMLANRDDGMDTFGNTGNLRIPYGTGFAGTLAPQSTSKDVLTVTDISTSTASTAFSQPFAQQPSKNPFGQLQQTTSTNNSGQQKSLLEMMQEQKLQQQQQQQQQQLQAQMTGYPQQNLYNNPQITGFNNMSSQPLGSSHQQQQAFGTQPQQQFGSQPQQQFNNNQPSFF